MTAVGIHTPATDRGVLGAQPGTRSAPGGHAACAPSPTPVRSPGNTTVTRALHLLTAASALGGIALDLWMSYRTESWLPPDAGFSATFGPGWDGVFNRFAYFTTVSNLLVAVTSLILGIRPEPRSRTVAALRVSALSSILLTGLVYAMVLLGPSLGGDYPVVTLVQSALEHVLTPLLATAAWILSLRRAPSWTQLALTPLFPALYLAVTLVRGAIIDWYPYAFLDVAGLGRRQVLVNVALVTALLPLITAMLAVLGQWLAPGSVTRHSQPTA